MFYLITFHESDGNNCTVYEAIREAENEDAALNALADEMVAHFDAAGIEYSEGGDLLDFYFECPDDCESLADDMPGEPCGLHGGGIVLRQVECFADESAARAARSSFHVEY